SRPSMIITRTHIGFGSPNRQDTAKAHGEALGKDEIALTKKAYGWPSEEPFFIPDEARAHWNEMVGERAALHDEWSDRWTRYVEAYPELAAELDRRMRGDLPDDIDAAFPTFDAKSGAIASRNASMVVINAIASKLPEMI